MPSHARIASRKVEGMRVTLDGTSPSPCSGQHAGDLPRSITSVNLAPPRCYQDHCLGGNSVLRAVMTLWQPERGVAAFWQRATKQRSPSQQSGALSR
jgi:hypothetical protein